MKALCFLRALPLALLLIAPARADQASIVGPTVGPKTMLEVMTAVNAGMLAIQSCNSGTSAPANGPGGVAKAFQCWADTSASPVITYKTFDGTSWVAFGKLNTSTHIWTAVYQGTDTGTASTAATGTAGHTLGFLDGANTWSAIQSFNSAMLSLKGSTSGAGTLNAPAVASTYVWTLPPLTDTLVGKATTDTFTNKTFDTAAAGNSLSINGLAATANTGTGSVVRSNSPTLVTPTLGAATATSVNGNIWTAGTGTLTLGAGKTATVSNTLTFAGTDGTTQTFPATSAAVARTDAGQTFVGTNTFGGQIISTVNNAGPAAGFLAQSAAAAYGFQNPANGVDQKNWAFTATGSTLLGQATNDANNAANNWLTVQRGAGTAVTSVTIPNFLTNTVNGNTITSGTGALTLGVGKTLTASNTLAFAGTDGSTINLGAGGTVAYLANTLSAFASTTSAQLATVVSDETGSGALVFGTSPTLVTPTLGVALAASINKVAITAPATGSTLTIPDGVTLTGPAASGTAMTLGNAETVTGAKSFNDATVILKGFTSGTTTVKAAAVAGTTMLTLPSATDTLVGKATADVLTNKTFDTAGAGNALAINGLAATANTGAGAVVRAVSPAITTPTGIVKGDVGLANVDNTSDANKPVSTAQAAANALKVNLTRNVNAGCGLAGGGDLSADRTIRLSLTVNAQAGTSYTVQDSDCGKLVSLSNASAVAVTLPQANGSTFISGWSVDFQNKGVGTVTVTPTTSTINGGGSVALMQNQGMHCNSDGTNYTCVLGVGAGSGAGTVTQVVCGPGLSGGSITASGTCANQNPTNLAERAGGFDVWQRIFNGATSLAQAASTTAYVNDGWYLVTNASQASTAAPVAGIASGSIQAAKYSRNSGQTGTGIMRVAMPLDTDEIAPMRGSYVALSFTIKEGANQSFGHSVNYAVYCGTGLPGKRGASAYAGESSLVSGTVTTATTASHVSYTSAGTVSAGCTQAEIQFNWSPSGTAGADDSVTIDDLQLEVVSGAASSASPYKFAAMQSQLLRSQRFLPVYTAADASSNIVGMGQNISGTLALGMFTLPSQTRAKITGVTVANPTSFIAVDAAGLANACNSLTYNVASLNSVLLLCTVTSGLVAGNATFLLSVAANAQILFTGAEL